MIFNNMFVFHNLYINLDCLSVCLFVSNKRQNGWTDRAQIFYGSSRDPREDLWMNFFHEIREQNLISNKFSETTTFFHEICELFLFLF